MTVLEFKAPTSVAAPARPRAQATTNLKSRLVAGDAIALALGFELSAVALGTPRSLGVWEQFVIVAVPTLAGLGVMKWQGLFLARVSAVRAVELTRLTYSAAILAVALVLADRVLTHPVSHHVLWVGTVLSWMFLIIARSAFRAWVRSKRATGQHLRKLILVGADSEIARLVELFYTHRELGLDVVGVVGDIEASSRHGLRHLWLGDVDALASITTEQGVTGVVVSPSSFTASRLSALIHRLQEDEIHVQIATGISGIDAGRLRSVPLSYEPLLYVEAPSLSKAQLVAKRVFDIVVSLLVLLLAAPVLLVIAIAIKVQDRGPVLFRQTRVGKAGTTFKLFKLRTMRVDAERMLAALQADNERKGPLFKMERDPRVTAFGRFLRETSLDELPQLINVLRGEMSLIGPRPALPAEVETFEAELRRRELVLPGITGLWQVEARDNPSFEAYRRLDLFYVANWSIVLDLMILIGTAEQLAAKIMTMAARKVLRRPHLGEVVSGGPPQLTSEAS
ncbi:MAG TPA: sugar transferase [Ilumatobacteraceae bacterium]|jgi:exopolysaccharide biosynthesis polyprenyl glycosylphosphotransferase